MSYNLYPELNPANYFEPDTVRITVHMNQHHGKFWNHTHKFYEFVYIDSGFSLHSYNGKTTVLTAGDLFAIFPGNVHSYTRAYHTDLYNCLFYLEELGSLKNEIIDLPGIDWERKNNRLPIIHVDLNERRELVSILERMRTERNEKNIGWELKMKALLTELLITYSRLVSEAGSKGFDENADKRGYSGYIYSVLNFVEEHYKEDIGSPEMAEAAGLSTDYLTKKFREVMAMTPSEYLRRFRVARSMDLLSESDMSVSEIAAECGFGDISVYSRIFKQVVGLSPAKFRIDK